MSDQQRHVINGPMEAQSPAIEGPGAVKILIVDDDPRNLSVLETVLADSGYVLVRAGSGKQALLALMADEFAVLVLDVRMPDMTGFELAQLVKERKKTARVPIIFLTAYYTEDQHVLEGYETGAVDYLYKPVNAAVLRSKVAVFADLHRKGLELEATNRLLQTEVSERRRAEQALQAATEEAQHANRAKSAFLAAMSHEIRTPMNGVMGLLELLGLTPLDSEQRATLNVIRQSGRSLLRIIDDILDLTRVEAGRLWLDPVPASVSQVVTSACEVHKGVASSRGLLFHWTLDQRISPALVFDPFRLGQILQNLISNALKFTHTGSVRVAVDLLEKTPSTERLRFSVADTGIGVEPGTAQQLFQPFTQAQGLKPDLYGGSGLGLAICRRLADLMDARVEMQSEVGLGTTMMLVVSFPVAAGMGALTASEPGPAEQTSRPMTSRPRAPEVAQAVANGTLVLVVDDHVINRMVLARQVSALGYAVELAEDGEEALEIWRSRRIGLILTDCQMPRMDGLALARAIRAIETSEGRHRVPIIACTANGMKDEPANCIEAGMDGCLIKPIALEQMAAAIDPFLTPPVQAGRDTKGLVDEEILRSLTLRGTVDAQALLKEFINAQTVDAVSLRQAASRADFGEVIRLTHRMKGACLMVGAVHLGDALHELEGVARAASHAELPSTLAAFESELLELGNYRLR